MDSNTGVKLPGLVSPAACGGTPAQTCKALGRRGQAELVLGCGVVCQDPPEISLRYLMTLPYQQRELRGDVAHTRFLILGQCLTQ